MIFDLKSRTALSGIFKSSKITVSPNKWFREQMEQYQSKPYEKKSPDGSLKGRYRSAESILVAICKMLHHYLRFGEYFDFTPESIRDKCDLTDLEGMLRDGRERKIKHKPLLVLLGVTESVGGYFGEVIVRNLGGEWSFPRWWRFYFSEIVGRPGVDMDHYFVIHKGNKIPILKIARWRFDGSGRVKSLYEVYKEIEATGKWSGSGKNRLAEFLEESKVLRKWSRMKGIK